MIRFAKNLYTSDNLEDIGLLKWRLKMGRGDLSLYVIAVNINTGRVEYFHNSILKQKLIRRQKYLIIGFSQSESECVDIIKNIVEESFLINGDYDFVNYLINRR